MDAKTEGAATVTVSAVIVRACGKCGAKRTLDQPCECGNTEAPLTHDLGIQSAFYKNPFKQLAWNLFGQHLATHRAEKANKEILNGHNS